MAVDTPARIAVLGAGPIGLEAALYARFLGYDVDLYERGRVAGNILRWGHVQLFTPFGMNRSTLGLAALRAQTENFDPPSDDALLTGREFVERYLLPLAQTDLLADSLHEQTEVVAIGRPGPLKPELAGSDERIDFDFRLLLRTAEGAERIGASDVVIDTTGVFGNPNWMGQGGIPAIGEQAERGRIEYGLPDILGAMRDHYAGKHVLLIGSGYSAATNVVALERLAHTAAETKVTWITRDDALVDWTGPVHELPNDRLVERARLAQQANSLAVDAASPIRHFAGTTVDAVTWDPISHRFVVRLLGNHAGELSIDRIIANVGFRPDNRIYAELQVHECYASGGPMKLAAALAGSSSADCLDQQSAGAEALVTPEPDFYILGAKSYGRDSRFLISLGLEQIRELFTLIGDRPELNLYRTIGNLPA
jgi:thioredoxin reductase